jgi:hypothetical protein
MKPKGAHMSFNDFMNKIRHFDNQMAKWITRHFYFMFFQVVLIVIFLFWFVNTFNTIDANHDVSNSDLQGKILVGQLINSTLATLLLIFNSFWLLFVFNIQQRIFSILKEVNYNIARLSRSNFKSDHKDRD